MPRIIKQHIVAGVTWIEIEEANLYLCCGCPADTIKHLKKANIIQSLEDDGWEFENGPNAILLSDMMIQNSKLSNLSEFVILHMLYVQGLNVPKHPNYLRYKPLLIGYNNQLQMQLDYVNVGNHGLDSVQDIVNAGLSENAANKIYATKVHYAGGSLKRMDQLVDTMPLEEHGIEIRKGVSLRRIGLNKFQIFYKGESEIIDLNLHDKEQYEAPYELAYSQLQPSRFSVTHTGEGNGWDIHRPCMASVLHHEGKTYLIDAGPNVLNNISKLGIGLSEIEGIFLSHIHDDHFAGITDLLNVEHKLKLFTPKLIKETARRKLNALFDSEIDLLEVAFDYHELQFGQWNEVDGMDVKPSYSPHTVETSIFQFRSKYKSTTRNYLHLADTINFNEFNVIVDNNPDIFKEADVEYVRDNYLVNVDLKKLDVGGGAIHGHLEDYLDDKSDKLVMAHTDQKIKTDDQRFVNARFGATDHLIFDDEFDHQQVKARAYLHKYFDTLPEEAIEELLNKNLVTYAPGRRIKGEDLAENIYLIISGIVKFTNQIGREQWVDSGNFIGHTKKYFLFDYKHQYDSLSYVVCLQFKESYIDEVFDRYKLREEFKRKLNLANNLRESYLVQHTLSGATYYELAGASRMAEIPNEEFSNESLNENIFIIQEGNVNVLFDDIYSVNISKNQHFGGLNCLTKYRRKQRFQFSNKVKVVSVPIEKMMQVPTLLWKLIELEEKRYQLSIFETK